MVNSFRILKKPIIKFSIQNKAKINIAFQPKSNAPIRGIMLAPISVMEENCLNKIVLDNGVVL